MELTLNRVCYPTGSNGTLLLNGRWFCYTIELPWKENRRMVSCIPDGVYALKKRWSLRIGWHLHVQDVPNRSYILIHAFNNAMMESKGCIAPVAIQTGHGIGLRSRVTLERLLAIAYDALKKKEPVFLTIKTIKNEEGGKQGR